MRKLKDSSEIAAACGIHNPCGLDSQDSSTCPFGPVRLSLRVYRIYKEKEDESD
jgi:hypothetical protein